MELFLSPNDPEHTVFVSSNGVAHYLIRTTKVPEEGTRVSRIQRPAANERDSIVAEIEWKKWNAPTVIRSPLLRGIGRCVGMSGWGIPACTFLYKRGAFSSSRYFVGDDGLEYRWKYVKCVGSILTRTSTNEEIARCINGISEEGMFAGQKKTILRIQPCSVDLDLVVLSFTIMEKKRRDKSGDGTKLTVYDEDPQGDGGGDAEGGEF